MRKISNESSCLLSINSNNDRSYSKRDFARDNPWPAIPVIEAAFIGRLYHAFTDESSAAFGGPRVPRWHTNVPRSGRTRPLSRIPCVYVEQSRRISVTIRKHNGVINRTKGDDAHVPLCLGIKWGERRMRAGFRIEDFDSNPWIGFQGISRDRGYIVRLGRSRCSEQAC